MSFDQPEGFTLRAMTPLDLPQCAQLTRRLQWAHRGEDWAQAFRVSKGVVLRAGERVVGTALSCVKGTFSSIGLITVDPDFQRRGLGRCLTKAALGIATRNVTLVATAEGRALYESLGFGENGVVLQLMRSPQALAHVPGQSAPVLRAARTGDVEEIHRLYRLGTGAFSQPLLDDLLATADCVLIAPGHDAETAGFCIVRPFGRGAVVGPIVAQSAELAVALIVESIRRFPQTALRIDVNNHPELADTLIALGFRTVSRVTRMSLGTPPPVDSTFLQYSLASQTLL